MLTSRIFVDSESRYHSVEKLKPQKLTELIPQKFAPFRDHKYERKVESSTESQSTYAVSKNTLSRKRNVIKQVLLNTSSAHSLDTFPQDKSKPSPQG
jgi:hypothetical protein